MPWYLFLGNTDLNKCILLAIEIRENISIYRWQNLNIVDTKWLDVQVKRNSKKKISRIIWKGANNMYRSWHTSRRTYNKMYRTNSNNNTHTDLVSTLCNVENPTSDFVSFSTSDQWLIHNIEIKLIRRWNVDWDIYARKYVLQKCISKTKYRLHERKIRKLKLKVSINTRRN